APGLHPELHSFPTRRSSDLEGRLDVYELMGKEVNRDDALATYSSRIRETIIAERFDELVADRVRQSSVKFDYDVVRSIQMEELEDRKSTRLNSSHVKISYAV